MPLSGGRPGDDDLTAALAPALAAGSGPLGVAVSGGGDSVALLLLALRAAAGTGRAVQAATVDHGLRPEAAAEARQVAALCAARGVPHEVLVWQTPQGPGNLMQRARNARLALLADWAARRGLGAVLLGHTADDVAETLLMGLARRAGIDGLTGPRPAFAVAGVAFLRPLLAVSREDLRAFLRRQGTGWAEDPTNDDPDFARVRARAALPGLAALGITAAGLARVAGHLAQARAALDQATAAAAGGLLHEAAGAVWIGRGGFAALPEEVQRRLLAGLLRGMTGSPHPPREAGLARLRAAVLQGGAASLGGLLLRPAGEAALLLREARALPGPVAPGAPWDGRWRLSGPFAEGDRIAALGAAALAALPPLPGRPPLPALVLRATPAVWRGATLIAAPLAAPGGAFAATCLPAFATGALSH